MHKVDAAMEAGGMPKPELIQGMGKLMGEMRRSGEFVDGAGLRPSATRVRLNFSEANVRCKGTVCRIERAGGRLLMLKVRDMDDAILGLALRAAVGDVELEIGPVTEGWDLGVMAKPVTLRCAA